jgi:hypothetical protein
MEPSNPIDPQPELPPQRPTVFQPITVQEVDQQCQDLRTLLTAICVALLVMSMALNLFLAKQMRQMRNKVSESRSMVKRIEAEFQLKEPNMRKFINALQSFATAHRDFQPVLDRYRAVLPQYLAAPVALSTTPAGLTVPKAATNAPAGRPSGQ